LIFCLVTSFSATSVSAEQNLKPALVVSPVEGPLNAPLNIKVTGAAPGARVTFKARRIGATGEAWTAFAVITADRLGEADPAKAPSIGGTYAGVSPHGLFCSVLPVAPDQLAAYEAAFPVNPGQPSTIAAPLERAPITVTATIGGREVGSTTVWRGFAVGTRGEEVADPSGWRGVYFPPAPGLPVGEPVVVLSGSGGGVFQTTAALLASNGYPTLALALYNYKDLPKALLKLPLEPIRDSARWLAQKSGTSRAAVLGISRGSEAAQLTAAYFPEAFSGVIAEVPSHLAGGALGPGTTPRDPAWSVNGRPIMPFPSPNYDLAKMAEAAKVPPGYQGAVDLLPVWNDPEAEARAGIPYDKIRAPLLVLAAGSDGMWPSNVSAERIRRRMAALGRSSQADIHVYPGAGHGLVFIGRGNAMSNFGYSSGLKGYISTGGTPQGDCEGSFQAFDQTLVFLKRLGSHR
jgi:pimeloyl-ACP methyl ester carboxylesterase